MEARLLRDTQRRTLRIYAAMAAWLVAAAALIAGTAGMRGAWWVAFPASVLACVLSVLPRSDPLRVLAGADREDVLNVLALHIGQLLATDRGAVYSALSTLVSDAAAGKTAPPRDDAWPGLLVAMQEAWLDREWRLVAVLLRLLGERGPTGFRTAIERYALGPASGPAEGAVRAAAQECLALLARREESERHAATLLRPAEPVSPSDTLLRPAGPGVAGCNSAALVRPAEAPADTTERGAAGPGTTS